MTKNLKHSEAFRKYDNVRRKIKHYLMYLEMKKKDYIENDPDIYITREVFNVIKQNDIKDLKFTISELVKDAKQYKKEIYNAQVEFNS